MVLSVGLIIAFVMEPPHLLKRVEEDAESAGKSLLMAAVADPNQVVPKAFDFDPYRPSLEGKEKKEKKEKAEKTEKPKKVPKVNYRAHASKVFALVAPIEAQFTTLLNVKLGDANIRKGVPQMYIQESEDCLAAARKINHAWQAVLSGGDAPTAPELQMDGIKEWRKEADAKLKTLQTMVTVAAEVSLRAKNKA